MLLRRLFATRCLLVHPILPHNRGARAELSLAEEGIGLAKSAGWEVDYGLKYREEGEEEPAEQTDEWKDDHLRESIAAGSLLRVRTAQTPTLFGKGQLTAVRDHIADNNISVVFVNTSLTPQQLKNLDKAWNEKDKANVSVIDRFGVILKIFSERAKTKTAKLQLELAWLKYLRARLVRGQGSTFRGLLSLAEGPMKGEAMKDMEVVSARERGGVGAMGGQGETQLEIERRLASNRESKIRQELEALAVRAKRQAKDSSLKSYPTIAIIGYTNAGKTALMNYLTGTDLVSENLLFQTLNTTARQLQLPSGQLGLILDTVGFISDLPHDLVEAFKATLEGAQNADVLLHIRDISHPFSEEQQRVVLKVLQELGVDSEHLQSHYVEAWNKVDKLTDPLDLRMIEASPFPVVPISALTGINCTKLLRVLDEVSCRVLKKRKLTLVFPSLQYRERMQWLTQNLNMVLSDVQAAGPDIRVDVIIDEVTLNRYLSHFQEEAITPRRPRSH